MKKIYCISEGSYSDWGIAYAFESKEKRDEFLELILKNCKDEYKGYEEYDITLDDERINTKEIEHYYFVRVFGIDSFHFEYTNSSETRNPKSVRLWENYKNKLFLSMVILITEEEYNSRDNKLVEKLNKIYSDTYAKVKYMYEVDGMSVEDIFEVIKG